MAHVFGTSSAHTSAATSPVTFSFTTAASDTVLVLMLKVDGALERVGGAPTFGGVTMTQADITRKAITGIEASAELWYLESPAAGAQTVSIPNTGAVVVYHMAATGRAGAGFASALDQANGAGTTGTNPSPGAVTTTVNGAIGFAIVATGAQTWAPSAQAGTVLNNTDDGTTGTGRQYHLQATAGATTLSWTFATSEDYGAVVAYFKESAFPFRFRRNPLLNDAVNRAATY